MPLAQRFFASTRGFHRHAQLQFRWLPSDGCVPYSRRLWYTPGDIQSASPRVYSLAAPDNFTHQRLYGLLDLCQDGAARWTSCDEM